MRHIAKLKTPLTWILKQEREGREEHEELDRWLTRLEATPANERLLPNESQRDRGIRVEKQRALAAEAAQLKLDSESPVQNRDCS